MSFYLLIYIWERASVSLSMFSAKQGKHWYQFIMSLVWRDQWQGIEPGTSRTPSQNSTTRLQVFWLEHLTMPTLWNNLQMQTSSQKSVFQFAHKMWTIFENGTNFPTRLNLTFQTLKLSIIVRLFWLNTIHDCMTVNL